MGSEYFLLPNDQPKIKTDRRNKSKNFKPSPALISNMMVRRVAD